MFSEREPLLDDPDIDALDRMLDSVFDAVASGELAPHKAVSGLKEVIAQIDSGNLGGAQDWFKNGLSHMKKID
ncbi:hypothetical protein [Pseudomonas bohemica]|uniref:hypothetical protein n=1 Tax=Pseudomonas bohemica TaxID=2044872 RepID=UPI000DA61803|nr:hypothetical protein [Pseudomonas bohemica]